VRVVTPSSLLLLPAGQVRTEVGGGEEGPGNRKPLQSSPLTQPLSIKVSKVRKSTINGWKAHHKSESHTHHTLLHTSKKGAAASLRAKRHT